MPCLESVHYFLHFANAESVDRGCHQLRDMKCLLFLQ